MFLGELRREKSLTTHPNSKVKTSPIKILFCKNVQVFDFEKLRQDFDEA
jgi:hypothetical protein